MLVLRLPVLAAAQVAATVAAIANNCSVRGMSIINTTRVSLIQNFFYFEVFTLLLYSCLLFG